MRKCKLISYDREHNLYKGESYIRVSLNFKIVLFGLFSYTKSIIYDVTMFEDYKEYIDYWDNLIKNKLKIKSKIKSLKIELFSINLCFN